jgi:hypothetical protein
VIKAPVRSPRANSYAERFVGTLPRVPGSCPGRRERQLRNILAAYARHYNGHRPHRACSRNPHLRRSGKAVYINARIERRQTLGGLISEYAERHSQKELQVRTTSEFASGLQAIGHKCVNSAAKAPVKEMEQSPAGWSVPAPSASIAHGAGRKPAFISGRAC